MKILLLSDTHSHTDETILNYAKQADEVWHAGDFGDYSVIDKLKKTSGLRGVYGNIDSHEVRAEFPEYLFFEVSGLKVFITHIGGYPPRYAKGVKALLIQHKPDLFISGHSHILKVMRDDKLNLLHMNPGAAGTHGFHKIRTMIRFEIKEGKIQNPEVIELGKRGQAIRK